MQLTSHVIGFCPAVWKTLHEMNGNKFTDD